MESKLFPVKNQNFFTLYTTEIKLSVLSVCVFMYLCSPRRVETSWTQQRLTVGDGSGRCSMSESSVPTQKRPLSSQPSNITAWSERGEKRPRSFPPHPVPLPPTRVRLLTVCVCVTYSCLKSCVTSGSILQTFLMWAKDSCVRIGLSLKQRWQLPSPKTVSHVVSSVSLSIHLLIFFLITYNQNHENELAFFQEKET